MTENIIVQSKLRTVVKDETGKNMSGDFAETLSKKAIELVKDAAKRADANNRQTIMAKDL